MQKQPEETPSPCLEHPVGQNPHLGTNLHQEKQSLHQREKCMRRIHSDGDGEGRAAVLQWDGERYPLASLLPSASFLHFFSILVGNCHPGLRDPVQPSLIPFF